MRAVGHCLIRKLALGVATLGLIGASTFAVTAHADEPSDVMERHKKHQEMMSSGKTTHEEAWSATNEKPSAEEARKVQEKAAKHKAVMESGKTTHEEGWSATRTTVSPAEAEQLRAKAKRHQELMNQGKPHEQAWQATDAEQATK